MKVGILNSVAIPITSLILMKIIYYPLLFQEEIIPIKLFTHLQAHIARKYPINMGITDE